MIPWVRARRRALGDMIPDRGPLLRSGVAASLRQEAVPGSGQPPAGRYALPGRTSLMMNRLTGSAGSLVRSTFRLCRGTV